MTITLYRNLSEPNVLDKNISSVKSLVGALRAGTSVINPTFTIEDDSVVGCNYIYVSEWGRYYYVHDIQSVVTGVWSVSCHVDVLMTYRNQIRNQSGIIARQENLYNLYLDDDKFLVDAQRIYWTKAFPNRVAPANSEGGSSFIFTVAGGANSGT